MTESGAIPVREGDLVAGKYRVGAVIGVGGMGVIVSARHEQLDQLVAIKFVRGEALGNEEAVQRFLREARAAARLKSEHAARVLDVGTLESGEPYMVMELLEGCDLAQALAERGPLPAELAAEWVAQACEALAEAHAAGIVHRDLKPQNLFLARTVGGAAKVKVLDFGVAKSNRAMTSGPGALTKTSAMLGSPLYMAPEQMRSSRDVDARTDIWALGVVLFELLTQRWPFEADTLPALCLKVVSDPARPLSELRPDVPETMMRIIARCLEKSVDKRYDNAAELASALEPLVPPGSRAVVERARLAMARRGEMASPLGSSPALPRSRHTGKSLSRMVPTPAAWGSGKGGGRESTVTRRPLFWAALAVFVVAGIGGGVLLLRDGPRDGRPTAMGSESVSAAPSRAPTNEPAAAKPDTADSLAPLASEWVRSAAPASAPTASAPAMAPNATSAAATPVGSRAGTAAARPPPAAKQPARDDDIPALR